MSMLRLRSVARGRCVRECSHLTLTYIHLFTHVPMHARVSLPGLCCFLFFVTLSSQAQYPYHGTFARLGLTRHCLWWVKAAEMLWLGYFDTYLPTYLISSAMPCSCLPNQSLLTTSSDSLELLHKANVSFLDSSKQAYSSSIHPSRDIPKPDSLVLSCSARSTKVGDSVFKNIWPLSSPCEKVITGSL